MAPNKDETSELLSAHTSGHSFVVDLERRRRQRLFLTLTIFCFFLALVGFIAVWIAHERPQLTVCRVVSAADENLMLLNSNVEAMSKVIEPGCETTVLIMRHCEKFGPTVEDTEKNEHCSFIGIERSQFVATLFGSGDERWPIPHDLFTLSPDQERRWNFRQWEILHPLARKFGLEVNAVGMNEVASEIFELLKSGSLCGQLVVVSWKHELIPGLGVKLGCGPDNGCPALYPEDSFDQVWQLKYVFDEAIKGEKIGDRQSGNSMKTPKSESIENVQPGDITFEPKDATSAESIGGNKPGQHRYLKQHTLGQTSNGWNIYATVSYLYFDPLSFSKTVGDYPVGGTPTGGRWDEDM